MEKLHLSLGLKFKRFLGDIFIPFSFPYSALMSWGLKLVFEIGKKKTVVQGTQKKLPAEVDKRTLEKWKHGISLFSW